MAVQPTFEHSDDLPQLDEVASVDMSAVSAAERARLRWFPDPHSPDTIQLFSSIRAIERFAPPSAQIEDDVKVVSSDDTVFTRSIRQASRQVYSRVYRMRGIVTADELDEDGMVPVDPSVEARTVRFLGINGRRVAAAGMVQADKKHGGLLSLPTFAHLTVDTDKLFAATGVGRTIDLNPDEFAEVTGLGVETIPGRHKTPGENNPVDVTYFEMLARSLVGMDRAGAMSGSGQSKRWWIMNVEKWLRDDVAEMAGEGNIHDLGDLQPYMGPETKPILLDVLNSVRAILDPSNPNHKDDAKHNLYAKYLRDALEGAEEVNIPDDIKQLLREQHVTLRSETRRQRMAEIIKDRRVRTAVGATALVGYSVARDLGAQAAGVYDGNLLALMLVDAGTATTQAWGMSEMVTRNPVRRAIGAVATGLSIAAPYAYVYLTERQKHPEGINVPWYVKPIVAAMVGYTVGRQVWDIVAERRLRSGLQRSGLEQNHAQDQEQLLSSGLLEAQPLQ